MKKSAKKTAMQVIVAMGASITGAKAVLAHLGLKGDEFSYFKTSSEARVGVEDMNEGFVVRESDNLVVIMHSVTRRLPSAAKLCLLFLLKRRRPPFRQSTAEIVLRLPS